jgi:hypothetical protein
MATEGEVVTLRQQKRMAFFQWKTGGLRISRMTGPSAGSGQSGVGRGVKGAVDERGGSAAVTTRRGQERLVCLDTCGVPELGTCWTPGGAAGLISRRLLVGGESMAALRSAVCGWATCGFLVGAMVVSMVLSIQPVSLLSLSPHLLCDGLV